MMYLSPEVYGDLYWPPRLRQAIYQIYHSSRHLLEMINDILDLSRFEIAGFTLAKEPTPLESLLRDTLDIAGVCLPNCEFTQPKAMSCNG
jgi:signal transduction histidine kinase